MSRQKGRLARAVKSPFARHFAVLFSGSAVAQALPVLASPLLTRLYSPAQFGEYALFVSGVNILSQLVCLKYDFAILTAKTDEEAAALLRLCALLSGGLALALAALLPFFGGVPAALGAGSGGWFYLLPFGALFTGLFSALGHYNTRLLCYRRITAANILRSAVLLAAQLLLFYAGLGALALTLGQVLAYAAGSLLLCRRLPGRGSLKGLWGLARGYSAFPKFTLPGALCGTAAFGSISFFLAAFYSPVELGCYSLVNRVLSAPLALLSATVGQVYTRELTGACGGQGGAGRVFRRVVALLAAVSLPLFSLLWFAAPPLIAWLFGGEWVQAGEMLRILLPMVALRFLVSPVTSTGIVLGRQLPTMLWQAGLLLAALAPAGLYALSGGLSLSAYLAVQSALLGVCYLVYLVYAARLVRKKRD